jgi:drug/metabolite transporter (DMT)-like permease
LHSRRCAGIEAWHDPDIVPRAADDSFREHSRRRQRADQGRRRPDDADGAGIGDRHAADRAVHPLCRFAAWSAYFYCLVRALGGGDLSSAYPIFRGAAPLITTLFSVVLLRETVHRATLGGIVLIAAGMLAMVAGRHVDRATLGWSLLTGVLIAVYTVIDATGVRAAPTPQSFIVWLFFLLGGVTMAVLPLFARGTFREAARLQWKSATLAGGLSILTFGIALYALSRGPTAPLAALRETGMVTALLISIFALKEPVTRGRVFAILTICCGAATIMGTG